MICQKLQVKEMDNQSHYLGLLMVLDKKKFPLYAYLINRFNRRWQKRNLCKAGKLVMIKAVLQNLPLHIMSCMKLKKTHLKSTNSSHDQIFVEF